MSDLHRLDLLYELRARVTETLSLQRRSGAPLTRAQLEALYGALSPADFGALLDIAIAVRRADEWLAATPAHEIEAHDAFLGEKHETHVDLLDNDPLVPARHKARGPDFLTALVRALDAAGGE